MQPAEIKSKSKAFITQHQSGISALLYIADYNMPTDRAISSRRKEIAYYVLRSIGYETLQDTIHERELDGQHRSLIKQQNDYESLLQDKEQILLELNNKELSGNKRGNRKYKKITNKQELEERIQEAKQWLSENRETVENSKRNRDYRKKIVNIPREMIETVSKPVSHDAFIQAAIQAKTDSADILAGLLATAGGILVMGTPEKHQGADLNLTPEEISLVREVQKIWGL